MEDKIKLSLLEKIYLNIFTPWDTVKLQYNLRSIYTDKPSDLEKHFESGKEYKLSERFRIIVKAKNADTLNLIEQKIRKGYIDNKSVELARKSVCGLLMLSV